MVTAMKAKLANLKSVTKHVLKLSVSFTILRLLTYSVIFQKCNILPVKFTSHCKQGLHLLQAPPS